MSPLDLLWLCFIVISLQPPYPRASKQPHLVAPAVSRAALRQGFGGTVEPDCCAAHLITARLGEQPILGAAGHRRPGEGLPPYISSAGSKHPTVDQIGGASSIRIVNQAKYDLRRLLAQYEFNDRRATATITERHTSSAASDY